MTCRNSVPGHAMCKAPAGVRGMAISYLYMAIGYGALKAVTPNFADLSSKEAFLEGVFRSVHNRLR